MVSSFLLAFMAVEAKPCTEEFWPAAKVLVGASATLELLPVILPLAFYRTEKVNSVRSGRDKGNRENRRGKNRFRRTYSAEGTQKQTVLVLFSTK